MFCRKCGAEINDEAVICVKCGCSVEEKKPEPPKAVEADESKSGVGAVMGLFLGILGLIIGLLLYKDGTNARQTFLKGWAIAFAISVGLTILFTIIEVALIDEVVALILF